MSDDNTHDGAEPSLAAAVADEMHDSRLKAALGGLPERTK